MAGPPKLLAQVRQEGRVFAEDLRGYRGWMHCATYPPRAPLIPTFPHGYPQWVGDGVLG